MVVHQGGEGMSTVAERPRTQALTHYVVVRRDLPFGVVLAMLTHAAGESFFRYGQRPTFRGSSVKERPAASVNEADGRSEVEVLPAEPIPGSPVASSSDEGERGPSLGPSTTHPIATAVVLGARSESKLLRLERLLLQHGVPHVAVREPDAPWSGQLMAVGLEPTADLEAVRDLVNEFQIWRLW